MSPPGKYFTMPFWNCPISMLVKGVVPSMSNTLILTTGLIIIVVVIGYESKNAAYVAVTEMIAVKINANAIFFFNIRIFLFLPPFAF